MTDVSKTIVDNAKVVLDAKKFKDSSFEHEPRIPRMLTGDDEKCKATMFKPNNIPHNTAPIGTEKLLSDGYVWMKIASNPKAKKQENWVQKHRFIYEKEYGEIPEGHCVIFLDGSRTNFDIDNLALVSCAEHVVLNRFGLRWDDANVTKAGINIAKIKLVMTRRGE